MRLLDVARPRTSMRATKAAQQNSGAYNRKLDNGSFETRDSHYRRLADVGAFAARVSAGSFGNPVEPPHGARESLRAATSLEAQCAITSLRIDLAQL